MATTTLLRRLQVTVVSGNQQGCRALAHVAAACADVSVSMLNLASGRLQVPPSVDLFLLCLEPGHRIRDLHRICGQLKQASPRALILLVATPDEAERFGVGSLIDGTVHRPVDRDALQATLAHYGGRVLSFA